MSAAVAGSSRVVLHDLSIRADRDEWIVGRVETGSFVAVPEIAVVIVRMLKGGRTVDDTRRRILLDYERDIDVEDFVRSFIDLGFVASVDGVQIPDVSAPRPSLPWISERAVRWIVAWPTIAVMLALVAAGAATLLFVPEIVPTHQDLLWAESTTVVVLGNVVIAWSIIFLHELAHLATARAYGVQGKISLGTRLQFLVAQTDVSGIWASPQRARLTVYLSGMAVNVCVAAVGVLVGLVAGSESSYGTFMAAVVLIAMLPLPIQFLVFMRTDVYYVLQDIAGCRNLYADGSAYVWWVLQRAKRRLGLATRFQPDPSSGLPTRERRAVRAYALLLSVGTAACLAAAVMVTFPFVVELISRIAVGWTTADGIGSRIDVATTVCVSMGFWMLWARAWWRRHGWRIRRWLRGGGEPNGPKGGVDHGEDRHPQAGQG